MSGLFRALAIPIHRLIMKNIMLFFSVLLYSPVFGQPVDSINREVESGKLTETVYSVTEFQRIADSFQMSVPELSCYPVISPIRNATISSGFGMRRHPVYKVRKFHAGIDIPKAKGTPVYAAGGGVVTRKGYNSGYGYFIEIEHAGGFRTFHANLSRTLVNAGDSVQMGSGNQLLLLRCQAVPGQTGDKYADCIISYVNKPF